MNRNQLYSRVITALIYNRITVYPNDMRNFLHYGNLRKNSKLDIFIYKVHYSLLTVDGKHIMIHKYVK